MIGTAVTTTAPLKDPGKGREKPKTHWRPTVMRYHPKNEVRLLVHLQTHCLIAVPARYVVSGEHSVKDNRQAFPTAKRAMTAVKRRRMICFTPPVICNIVTAPESQQARPMGQNGHCGGKQLTGKELKFFQHIGSVDREGVAKTRRARTTTNFEQFPKGRSKSHRSSNKWRREYQTSRSTHAKTWHDIKNSYRP